MAQALQVPLYSMYNTLLGLFNTCITLSPDLSAPATNRLGAALAFVDVNEPGFSFDVHSGGEPVPASLENALSEHEVETPGQPSRVLSRAHQQFLAKQAVGTVQ
jgi:hypothetical protein